MHRRFLLEKLACYRASNDEENKLIHATIQFVKTHVNCLERNLQTGHITAAAWIVNADRTHVLLTHHRKLNKWLQLGGHADGDPDVLRVAIREAQEESGIDVFVPVSEDIFDIDIHQIPSFKSDPLHLHYDIRFILEADMRGTVKVTHESHDVQWIPLNKVQDYTSEASIMRMVKKTCLK
ncbi:NUDIX hydrolase [bacterium]|nr:NUDIX hydrolase [bacterium]